MRRGSIIHYIRGARVFFQFVTNPRRQSKVTDDQMPVYINEDVVWFDIAMDDTYAVQVSSTANDLGHAEVNTLCIEFVVDCELEHFPEISPREIFLTSTAKLVKRIHGQSVPAYSNEVERSRIVAAFLQLQEKRVSELDQRLEYDLLVQDQFQRRVGHTCFADNFHRAEGRLRLVLC
jgi:hypothetical protein